MRCFFPIHIVVFSILFCFTNQTFASSDGSSTYLFNNKTNCIASPGLCLNQLDERIKNIQEHSTQWYRLTNLKLLAIWEIRDVKWLKKEIHKYVDLYDAPPVFLTTVYTLHAKMLFSSGSLEEGTLYANKSVELIKKVNEVSFDADRYAEIILLYNQLNRNEDALEFIAWINKRIENMGPIHYFPKLQTAIAHTYTQHGDHDLALEHYQYALKGFIETNYRLEAAEGYHNVARALQGQKEYGKAIPAFEKALQWMNVAVKEGDYSIEAKNYTQLRLIETLQNAGQNMKATLLLNDVIPKDLDEGAITLYQKLKFTLNEDNK
jgi:tetratricopeptide (TPR) repeat protein